jgi:hypothetical protein
MKLDKKKFPQNKISARKGFLMSLGRFHELLAKHVTCFVSHRVREWSGNTRKVDEDVQSSRDSTSE